MNRHGKWAICILAVAFVIAWRIPTSPLLPARHSATPAFQQAAAVASSRNVVPSNVNVAKSLPAVKLRATSVTVPAPRAHGSFGEVPLSFEENCGQTDASVKYLARGKGYTLFLAPDEAVLSFRYPSAKSKQEPSLAHVPNVQSKSEAPQWSQANVRLSLIGANTAPRVAGVDKQQGISNYFIGNDPAQWHTEIPNYGRVLYQGVYPGVDVAYYGNEGQLETDFILAPQAQLH